MIQLITCLSAFLIWNSLGVCASEKDILDKVPWPTEPCLPVPKNARWKIEGSIPASNKDTSSQVIESAISTMVGPLKKIEITSPSNGGRFEIWFMNNFLLQKDASNLGRFLIAQYIEGGSTPMAEMSSFSHGPGFPSLSWVNLSNYKRPEINNGRICHKYIQPPKTYKIQDESGLIERTMPEVTAWVDAETKRPVAVSNGSTMYHYTFMEPPSTLELPSAYKVAIQKKIDEENRIKKLEAPRTGP